MKSPWTYIVWVMIIVSLRSYDCHAFDINAHAAMSRRAIDPKVTHAAKVDSYLKNTLRFEFSNGIAHIVDSGKRVDDLIAEGSIQEDSPVSRVLHHFHDPTRTWDQAGERFPPGIPLGNSSVVWSQMSPQGACCGNYAWKDARDSFHKALTSTTTSERKSWYAKTFETLGHLIHHVQDAAVPSHTRNDNHLQPFGFTKLPDGDPFHQWADSPIGLNQINNVNEAIRFDPTILNQSSANPLAPVPIARIIDKTDEDFGVLSPNLNIGLAEYSNANFISKGTARSTTYLYPRYSQLQFDSVETLPNGKRVRYARFRPGFGEQDYRVGVSSRMARFVNSTVPPDSIDFGLDDKVHEDYGKKLFPRAIGYSAGLIDYFFRGKIDSTLWSSPGYVLTPFSARPASIRVDNVSIKAEGSNEQGNQGTLRLVLLFSFKFADSPDGYPPVVVSHEVSFSGGTQTVVFPFDSLPFPPSYPALSGSHAYAYWGLLVYKGALGQESAAVAAGSDCIDPTAGARYPRWYQFEHSVPNLWFVNEDAAYIHYGC